MKHIAFACGVLALSACAQTAEISSRSADLPGIQTTINCNPEPTLVYAKTGQLIEKIMPILHPSCRIASSRAAVSQVEEDVRPASEPSMTSKLAKLLKLGPATYSNRSKLEADEGEPARVADATNAADASESSSDENVASGTPSTGGTDSSDDTSTSEQTGSNGGASSNDASSNEGGTSSQDNSNEESGSNEETTSEGSNEETASEEENNSNEGESSNEAGGSGEESNSESAGSSSEESASEQGESSNEEGESSTEEQPRVLTKIEELKQLAGVPF